MTLEPHPLVAAVVLTAMAMVERVLRAALVAAAALALTGATAADAATLRITKALCTPTQKCVADPHQVAPGGKLILRGRGLARGQFVIFKRGSGRTITSKLRKSRVGLIVVVPPTAKSGRIRVRDRFGRRS